MMTDTSLPARELQPGDRIWRKGMLDIVREVHRTETAVELYLAYAGRTTLDLEELVERHP